MLQVVYIYYIKYICIYTIQCKQDGWISPDRVRTGVKMCKGDGGNVMVPLNALHSAPPPSPWQLARLLPMTVLVCSVQLAVDFQMHSAILASGNGKAGTVGEILYPTLSNSVQPAYT